MGHRNMMDQQGQGYLYHGPPPVPASFQPPMVSSGPTYEAQQYLPADPAPLFYGAQYNNGVHHHHHHHHHGSFYQPSFDPAGYGGNYYLVDGIMVPGKGKLMGVPENFHHHHHHHHLEPVVPFPVPPPFGAAASNGNHLIRGNFQPNYQPYHVGTSSSADAPPLLWNQGPQPGVPFVHAPPMEAGNSSMGIVPTVRSSQSLRHANQRHHQTHLASPHAPRLNNGSSSSSAAGAGRVNHRSLVPPSHGGLEMGHRHAGAPAPTGIRIYRPHRGPDSSSAPRNFNHHHQHLAQLRYIQTDEVAILEIPDYYEYNSDNHSDLRLDIEDMSYEELLALGDRIGNVNTGLSEETITGRLKTIPYLSPRINLNLEVEPDCSETEEHCCIICQDNYTDREKVGVLDCGHEYHAECLTKWLLIKNVCPICKCEALSTKTGHR